MVVSAGRLVAEPTVTLILPPPTPPPRPGLPFKSVDDELALPPLEDSPPLVGAVVVAAADV